MLASGMSCAGRAANLVHYVMQGSRLRGDVVEFGCHAGRTAAVLAMVSHKPVWLYDSFQGLPARGAQDASAHEPFKEGALVADEDSVQRHFATYKLPPPRICRGWFSAIPVAMLPGQICFAHLDGDFYSSIMYSLALVYPRLVSGAACVIDDCGWVGLPGVLSAVNEFMFDKKERPVQLVTSNAGAWQAVITKF